VAHGTADWRVSLIDTLNLAERLLAHQIPLRPTMMEGGDRGLGEYELEIQTTIRGWFGRYLAPDAQPRNETPQGTWEWSMAIPETRKPREAGGTPKPMLSKWAVSLRWALVIGGVILFNVLAARGLTELVEAPLSIGLSKNSWVGVVALAAYAVLLALPFVPGVEIGLSLLIMQGSSIAPLVHVATVVGLSVSYGVGRAFATTLPCSFLRSMGLPRACAFVDAMKDLDRPARLQKLQDVAPQWVGRWVIGHRYVLLALLINLPGNSLIGGGGGILLVVGLSRMFSYPATFLTLVLATAPIPLAVWFLGVDVLQ